MPQPNVVFIFTDQQSRFAMSAYGNPDLHTPHMDALARNGIRFQHAYCTSPVCSPSRASLVTGLLPHAHGVNTNNLSIHDDVPTMGEVFRAAGYETVWAGKWHVPMSYPVEADDIRGFHTLVVPGVEQLLGLGSDDCVTEQAVDFLQRDHAQPFLLAVSLHNPHDICYWITTAERAVLEAFNRPGYTPALPANFAIDPDEPEFVRACRERDHYGPENRWTKTWTREDWVTYLNVYYRLTEHVDRQVGRMLTALREQGLEEETLVVFTSDHGEGMAAHHWVVKLMLYEEPVTVPFIISQPGVVPADIHDTTHLVSGADLLPTLCDYAGIAPPPGLHGQSLRPVIEQPELPGRDFVVTELQPDTEKPEMKGRMLRTRQYKYLAFSHGRNREMLFDLAADAGETRNLAGLPAYAGELARHRQLLARWVDETQDAFAVPPVAHADGISTTGM